MLKYIVFIFVLLAIGFMLTATAKQAHPAAYVAPSAPASQKNWWRRDGWMRFGYPYYSFWESFVNLNDRPADVASEKVGSLLLPQQTNESAVMDYPPDTPGPADLYNNSPYHLLADEMPPPRTEEALSCVNSRSCYASDFDRMVSKTGTYRQMTNNYKRGYPDSCSSPYQELVLNFYETDAMHLPSNNTGGSVSEVEYGMTPATILLGQPARL
jgi:hypothetical protein